MQKTIYLIWKSGKKRIQKIRKKRRYYNALTDAKIMDKTNIL
jgi:3-keto-L-gulonate-6-phosphate decarboxylase